MKHLMNTSLLIKNTGKIARHRFVCLNCPVASEIFTSSLQDFRILRARAIELEFWALLQDPQVSVFDANVAACKMAEGEERPSQRRRGSSRLRSCSSNSSSGSSSAAVA